MHPIIEENKRFVDTNLLTPGSLEVRIGLLSINGLTKWYSPSTEDILAQRAQREAVQQRIKQAETTSPIQIPNR